jgi:hypothetical protein
LTIEAGATGDGTNQPGDAGNADGTGAAATGADPNAKPVDGAVDPAKAGETKADPDYKFTAPEGIELDQARLTEFTTIAKDLKLPAEAAQKLVDLASKAETARVEAHVAQVAKWAEDVKADKDLGGDKLQESAATARKAIDLGPPELKQFLNDTGLGNHPLLFKTFHAIGKALSEESTVVRGGTPAGQRSAADVLYGSSSTPKT